MKLFVRRLLVVTLLATTLVAAPHAAELSGVKMPDQLTVGEHSLVLNGLGMRKVTIIKVYVGGLYLPAKSHDAAAILAADAPRAIRMEFVRNVDKGRLTGGFREGLQKNGGAKFATQKVNIDRFLGLIGDQKKGAVMTFAYTPAAGTSVQVDGKELGSFEGREFGDLLFSVWLGASPPSTEPAQGHAGAVGAARDYKMTPCAAPAVHAGAAHFVAARIHAMAAPRQAVWYSSIGGQAQTRLRSPYALSTRPTAGQNLRSRTHGSGNAARSRE